MQVGIPRAMSYYSYFPFWFGFFEDLGIEVVISDRTTKETMSRGSALVVSETCLPIKVYVGHILNLLDKGIDKIFDYHSQIIQNRRKFPRHGRIRTFNRTGSRYTARWECKKGGNINENKQSFKHSCI